MSGIHQCTLYTLLNDHLERPGVSPRVNDSYLEARLQQGSLHLLESCTIKEDVSKVQTNKTNKFFKSTDTKSFCSLH